MSIDDILDPSSFGHDRKSKKTGSRSHKRKKKQYCGQSILYRISKGKPEHHTCIKNKIKHDIQKATAIAHLCHPGQCAIDAITNSINNDAKKCPAITLKKECRQYTKTNDKRNNCNLIGCYTFGA